MSNALIVALKRSKFMLIGAVIAVSAITASVATFAQPQSVAAACTPQDKYPNTNIIYCGLTGSTAADQWQSFKTYYNNNDDGHGHTDLQSVYNDTGLTSAMLKSSDSWYLGTSYKDGTITVNGQEVAKDMQIGSRCFSGMSNCQPTSAYKYLTSNVYMHAASFYFDDDGTPIPTLVHLNSNGAADFAFWGPCGNALQFTQVTPPKSLNCVSLSKEADSTLEYTFTAKASEQNETISKYVFDFGDNTNTTVNVTNNATTATTQHTYNQTDKEQDLTAQVSVNGNVTSDACKVSVTIPPKQQQKSLACVELTATPDSTKLTYNFTVTAQATNTDIASYTFDFGDSKTQTFNVSNNQATFTTSHTYVQTSATQNFTAKASVTGSLGTFTADACQKPVSIPPTIPPQLTNTGAGSVLGIFSLATIGGGLFHRFILKRKFIA